MAAMDLELPDLTSKIQLSRLKLTDADSYSELMFNTGVIIGIMANNNRFYGSSIDRIISNIEERQPDMLKPFETTANIIIDNYTIIQPELSMNDIISIRNAYYDDSIIDSYRLDDTVLITFIAYITFWNKIVNDIKEINKVRRIPYVFHEFHNRLQELLDDNPHDNGLINFSKKYNDIMNKMLFDFHNMLRNGYPYEYVLQNTNIMMDCELQSLMHGVK